MGAAESKFSPQIVAGSYIGWLGAILQHMTGRYRIFAMVFRRVYGEEIERVSVAASK